MKCEICHEAEAATAITREANGTQEELYVCKACAETERKNRQKRSQRTRKSGANGVSITVHRGEGEPPFLRELMNVMNDIVDDIEKVKKAAEEEHNGGKSLAQGVPEPERAAKKLPLSRVDARCRIGKRLHLEGLYIIGELSAVGRALRALGIDLIGASCDGIAEPGHAYTVEYRGSIEQARRVVADLVTQEKNARVRLVNEMPRLFGDSVCRALAVLKNCRMLSAAEEYDLLSPLRLAAREKFLDGIDLAALDELTNEIDLSGARDELDIDERDKIDCARADEMNRRFEDVMLNERAEERFL